MLSEAGRWDGPKAKILSGAAATSQHHEYDTRLVILSPNLPNDLKMEIWLSGEMLQANFSRQKRKKLDTLE